MYSPLRNVTMQCQLSNAGTMGHDTSFCETFLGECQHQSISGAWNDLEKRLDSRKPRTDLDVDEVYYIDWTALLDGREPRTEFSADDGFRTHRAGFCHASKYDSALWLETAFDEDHAEFARAREKLPSYSSYPIHLWLETIATEREGISNHHQFPNPIEQSTMITSPLKRLLPILETLGREKSTYQSLSACAFRNTLQTAFARLEDLHRPFVDFEGHALYNASIPSNRPIYTRDYELKVEELVVCLQELHQLSWEVSLSGVPHQQDGAMSVEGVRASVNASVPTRGKRKRPTFTSDTTSWQFDRRRKCKRNKPRFVPGTSVM